MSLIIVLETSVVTNCTFIMRMLESDVLISCDQRLAVLGQLTPLQGHTRGHLSLDCSGAY